jgi:hypothetical protein
MPMIKEKVGRKSKKSRSYEEKIRTRRKEGEKSSKMLYCKGKNHQQTFIKKTEGRMQQQQKEHVNKKTYKPVNK